MTTAIHLLALLAWFAASAALAGGLLLALVATVDVAVERRTGVPWLTGGPWIGGKR